MIEGGRRYRYPQPAFEPASGDPASIDALVTRLDPAAQAIVGLYRACRLEGERYADCFARLGAPSYAAILREALTRAA